MDEWRKRAYRGGVQAWRASGAVVFSITPMRSVASTKAKEASRMRPARLFGQENEMDSLSLLLPLLNS
jgi:hypothetical protein